MTLASLTVGAHLLMPYVSTLSGLFSTHGATLHSSIPGLLLFLFDFELGPQLFIVLSLIAGVALAFRAQLSASWVLGVGVPVSLLLAPYVWTHDFVLLVVNYLALVAFLYKRSGLAPVALIGVVQLVGVGALISERGLETFTYLYALSLVALWWLLIGKPELAELSPS